MLKQDCIFCRIVKKEIPAKVVYEDNKILAFEDLKPQAPVHVLVIPKHHIEKVSDLNDSNLHLVASLVMAAKDIARDRKIQDSGYRIVMNCNRDAGQEVLHLHLHLLGGRLFGWPPG